MPTLAEQLQQMADALNIAGVPAIAQPGVPITASLSPPPGPLQFTDVVATDIGLDLIAKEVVFTNTDFTSPAFVEDPAITKTLPMFDFLTVPPTADTSGVPGLIGKISGTVPLPIQVEAIPEVTVEWFVDPDNGYSAPQGRFNPTFEVIFHPIFVPLESSGVPPTVSRRISATVTLTAVGETATVPLGPVNVAIPAIPVPKVLALSLHRDFRGAALVMVPAASPVVNVNQLKSLLQPVRNALSTLTTVVAVAEFLLGIETLSGVLEEANVAFTKSDAVSNLNNIDLITRPWYELNDTEAEDELSSFVYVSPPPQFEGPSNAVEMFNRRGFSAGAGKFTVTTGVSFVALCRDLHTAAPTVTPGGATLTVNNTPPTIFGVPGSFGDRLSSIRFI